MQALHGRNITAAEVVDARCARVMMPQRRRVKSASSQALAKLAERHPLPRNDVVKADVTASNGVIHVIDEVLIPSA
jgi:uncharacterized surface protein with fasciclin (FAS1) repeats